MLTTRIAILLLLSPGAALACERGQATVLSCPTYDDRQIKVCQAADSIHYQHGKPGQPPEVKLSQDNPDFLWERGESASAGNRDALLFTQGTTRYVIEHVADSEDPTDVYAYVSVQKPGQENGLIECSADKITFNPEAIKAAYREMTGDSPPL